MAKRPAQSKPAAADADNASPPFNTPAWRAAWKARGWEAPPTPPPANPYEDQQLYLYAATLRSKFGFVRFVGLPTQGGPEDTPIQELFVEPALSPQRIDPASDPKQWPATTPLIEAVLAHPRLVALGDPGSGKSTLISWIVYNLLSRESNPLKDALGALVPITLVLRDLELPHNPTWEDVLAAFVKHPSGQALGSVERIERLLQMGHAVVLIDGLDEAGGFETRAHLAVVLHAAMRDYAHARFVVTSRVVGYDDAPVEFAVIPHYLADKPGVIAVAPEVRQTGPGGFIFNDVGYVPKERLAQHYLQFATLSASTRLYVAPFDDSRIDLFVRNWHERHETDRSSRGERVADLLAALNRAEGVKPLSRIPNMLTLIALVYRVYVKLPDGRAELYERIAQAYLESIDIARKLPTLGHPLTDMKRWLGYVAFQMQRLRFAKRGGGTVTDTENVKSDADGGKDNGILVSRTQLLEWISFAMQHGGSSRIANVGSSAAAFVDWIARRAGLILPRSEDLFAFAHLSFQEYFAAWFLHEQVMDPGWLAGDEDTGPLAAGTDKKTLQAATHDIRWQETFILMFELLGSKGKWPDHVFKKLFERPVATPEEFRTIRELNPTAPIPRETLMARVAADEHTSLSESVAKFAYARAWEAYAASVHYKFWLDIEMPPALAQTLLRKGSDGRSLAIEALAQVDKSTKWAGLGFSMVDLNTWLPRLAEHRETFGMVDVFSSQHCLFRGPAVAALVASDSPFRNLRALQINSAMLDRECIAAISSGRLALTNLHVLDLVACSLGDEEIEPLVSATSRLTELRALDLSRNHITEDGVMPLCDAGSPLRKLQRLDLDGNYVSEQFVYALCVKPSALPHLQGLYFASDQLSDRAIELITSPQSHRHSLRQLALSSSEFTDLALDLILRPDSGLKHLEALHLGSPRFTADGVRRLRKITQAMPKLRSLHIGGTDETRLALDDLRSDPDMVPTGWSLYFY